MFSRTYIFVAATIVVISMAISGCITPGDFGPSEDEDFVLDLDVSEDLTDEEVSDVSDEVEIVEDLDAAEIEVVDPCDSCQSYEKCCDGVCIDTDVSSEHCGGCGVACSETQVCNQGVCGCPVGQDACGDSCHDFLSDFDNCGSCNNSCARDNAQSTCDTGICAFESCEQGFLNCNDDWDTDGCEIFADGDVENCGACGVSCFATEICVSGECECPSGLDLCDETCVDLTSDLLHCGSCENDCSRDNALMQCDGQGGCTFIECEEGFVDCNGDLADGCEIDTINDPLNCGGCSINCLDNERDHVCDSGACIYGCGDGICNETAGEMIDCPQDCPYEQICGDGFCDANSEDIDNCPEDCTFPGSPCGNGNCSSLGGESFNTCSDCWNLLVDSAYEDGVCGFRENCSNSTTDCGECLE